MFRARNVARVVSRSSRRCGSRRRGARDAALAEAAVGDDLAFVGALCGAAPGALDGFNPGRARGRRGSGAEAGTGAGGGNRVFVGSDAIGDGRPGDGGGRRRNRRERGWPRAGRRSLDRNLARERGRRGTRRDYLSIPRLYPRRFDRRQALGSLNRSYRGSSLSMRLRLVIFVGSPTLKNLGASSAATWARSSCTRACTPSTVSTSSW